MTTCDRPSLRACLLMALATSLACLFIITCLVISTWFGYPLDPVIDIPTVFCCGLFLSVQNLFLVVVGWRP